MNVYPDGHKPFRPRGLPMDENTVKMLRQIAQYDFYDVLWSAWFDFFVSRNHLEQLRFTLFRAEQLIETQPLPVASPGSDMPQAIDAMLETLEAARKCLEEWKESRTCKAIVEQSPRRKGNIT